MRQPDAETVGGEERTSEDQDKLGPRLGLPALAHVSEAFIRHAGNLVLRGDLAKTKVQVSFITDGSGGDLDRTDLQCLLINGNMDPEPVETWFRQRNKKPGRGAFGAATFAARAFAFTL